MKHFLLLYSSFLLILMSSCYKEKDTTAAVEVLRASDSTAVGGINVRLYFDGSERIDTTLTSSSLGKVSVDFTEEFKAGQGGFAVLDIDLRYEDGTGEAKVGVIKVEEENDNEQTVYCFDC